LKFGVSLANIGSLGPGVGVRGCLDIAQAADELGFDSVCVGDHLVLPVEIDYDESHRDRQGATRWKNDVFEALTVLSAVAATTKRVRLFQGIMILPLRHPILLAKVGATIDCISNGRFILGAGVGWMPEEFDALGLPEGYFEHRGSVGSEYLRAVKELWTSDGPSNFRGRFISFENIGAYPKPVQRPHPPIVVGGSSRPAMLRAIGHGDGWDCGGDTPEAVGAKIEEFRALCRERGRDPASLEISMNWILRPGAHGMRITPRAAGADRPVLTGSPDEIVSDLRRFEAAGIQHLVTLPRAMEGAEGEPYVKRVLRGMEIAAREILPAIR
jgi:probable F420-dependent oxidoreductase